MFCEYTKYRNIQLNFLLLKFDFSIARVKVASSVLSPIDTLI